MATPHKDVVQLCAVLSLFFRAAMNLKKYAIHKWDRLLFSILEQLFLRSNFSLPISAA
jgi:hypothetical protein